MRDLAGICLELTPLSEFLGQHKTYTISSQKIKQQNMNSIIEM